MSKAMTFRHGPDTSSSRVPALSLTMTANSLRRQRRLRRRALRGPAELGQQPELVEEDLDLGGLAALEPRYDRDRRSNGAVRRGDRRGTGAPSGRPVGPGELADLGNPIARTEGVLHVRMDVGESQRASIGHPIDSVRFATLRDW